MHPFPLVAQAAEKSYHETFWAALAGAAAVVIVAMVLSVSVGARVGESAPFTLMHDKSVPAYRTEQNMGRVLFWGALVTYGTQGFALLVSLWSLSSDKDRLPPDSMIWLELAALLMVPVWIWLSDYLGHFLDEMERSKA